jgi:hypothetical protein
MAAALTAAAGTNGTAPARGKRPASPKGKRPGPAARAQAKAAQRAVRWSNWYTGTAIPLSSGLNGYAAVQASGAMGTAGMVAAGFPEEEGGLVALQLCLGVVRSPVQMRQRQAVDQVLVEVRQGEAPLRHFTLPVILASPVPDERCPARCTWAPAAWRGPVN